MSSVICFSHEGMSTGGDGSSSKAGGNAGGKNGTPTHGTPTPMDKTTLKVHLPNGEISKHKNS